MALEPVRQYVICRTRTSTACHCTYSYCVLCSKESLWAIPHASLHAKPHEYLSLSHIGPGVVTGVQDVYPAVLWGPPVEPNGVITSYQLTFTRGGQRRTVTTTLPHYVIRSQDVPGSSGRFTVEVYNILYAFCYAI